MAHYITRVAAMLERGNVTNAQQKYKEHLDAHSSGYKWDSKRGYVKKARQI